MGLYRRTDSPFWWMWLEAPPGGTPTAESTRVKWDAPTSKPRKAQKELAEQIYHQRAVEFMRTSRGLDPKPTITFTAYATWYETNISPTHGAHARERSMLTRLRRTFGDQLLHTIDRAAVLEWRTARLAEVAPATVDRELDLLKSVFASAIPKYLDTSPIRGLRRHRETVQSKKRRPRILEADEERRLLAKAKAPQDRALLLVALDTLMRLSDVKNLRRDRDYGTYLHVEAPKVDPYDVPVSTRLRAALDALPARGPYYFPKRWGGRDGAIAANTVWRIFKQLCEAAHIPVGRKHRGLTFHSLRHTGTTRMLEAGHNPIAVMEIGGWRELRQLVRYGRASQAAKEQAVNAIAPVSSHLRSRRKARKRFGK